MDWYTVMMLCMVVALLLWAFWWNTDSRRERKRKRQLKKKGQPAINSLELDEGTMSQMHQLLMERHPPYAREHARNDEQ